MPLVAEAPTDTAVKVKMPSLQSFQKVGLAGRSPMDISKEKPALAEAGSPDSDEPMDSGTLKAAQAKDVSRSEPTEVDDDDPPPVALDAKPTVPDLPVSESWRPKGEKAGKQWDELKTKHASELSAIKVEVERARAELAAAKSVGDADEVKAIKEQLKQYQEVIRDVAIEKDPNFKQKFEPREKTAIDAAKLAAGDQGAKLETLLKSPPSPWRDEQIEEIKSELSSSSQIRVDSALRMLDQIDLEKQSEIAVQRSNFSQKQMAMIGNQKEQQAAHVKAMTSAFDSTLKNWSDKESGHPFLVEREGDKEFNAEVAVSKALAENLHKSFINGELEPEDIAKAMLHVAVAERTLKASQDLLKRAEKAERALAKLRGVQPGDGRVGKPEAEDEFTRPDVGTEGFMKDLNARLHEAQEKDRSRGR